MGQCADVNAFVPPPVLRQREQEEKTLKMKNAGRVCLKFMENPPG